jgi:hypothetical protein
MASPMNYSFSYIEAVSNSLYPALTIAYSNTSGSLIGYVPRPRIGISIPLFNKYDFAIYVSTIFLKIN